jgi:membrane-bound serine protease (ClpP class)
MTPMLPRGTQHAAAWRIAGAVALGVLAALWSARSASAAGKLDARIGRFVHVSLPVNHQTFQATRQVVRQIMQKAAKDKARLVLVFQFEVAKGQKDYGRGSDFGAAYDLANFLSSDELGGVRTVAYLPQSIEGHAVLAAIACQEIIMAKDAKIGPAGVDIAVIDPPVRSAYREIASRRQTVPVNIALGLLDKSIEILQVQTVAGTEYVTPEGLEKLKQQRAIGEPVVVKPAGEPCEFTAAEARRRDFVKYLADDRQEVLRALELPPTAIEDDPAVLGAWRPVRIDLKGPIRHELVDNVKRMIDDQLGNNVNFICLWIDSPGGEPDQAIDLANHIAGLDSSKVRTVAYVPREARSVAAVVALACDQLVMHPRAVLGGSGAYEPTTDEIESIRQVLRDSLARHKGRSWSLMAALVDPRLNVYRAVRLGDVEYFCDDELQEQPDRDRWQRDLLVTTPGKPLELDGAKAEEYHLAKRVVDSFGQFKQYYGLQDDPTLVEPGWADFLIRALASPGVAVFLLIIGLVGLYVELHAPGTAMGAFVAAVCFLLFFWSRSLEGTAVSLEIMLFVAGITCILLEVFVFPGFAIFGLGGGAMVLASIVLASQTSRSLIPHNEYQRDQLQTSLLTVLGAIAGFIAVAIVLRHRLPRSPLLGHILLEPPEGEEAETIRRRESLVDFQGLLGARGATTTKLTPSGKARFGDTVVDVMSEGDAIDRGAAVDVVEIRGNHVIVKQVDT